MTSSYRPEADIGKRSLPAISGRSQTTATGQKRAFGQACFQPKVANKSPSV